MANRSTKKSPKKKNTKTVKAKKSVELKGGEILRDEIMIITLFVFSILLMLSNFGLGGRMGNLLKGVQLGSFGTLGYLFPIVVLLIGIILVSNNGNIKSGLKSLAIIVVLISVSSIVHVFMDNSAFSLDALREVYHAQNGGGLLGGLLGGSLKSIISSIGAFVVLCMIIIIALVYISERSFVSFVKLGSKKVYKQTKEDIAKRKVKKAQRDTRKKSDTQEKKIRQAQKEDIYIDEDEQKEEFTKPRKKIDFTTTTLDIADDMHIQNVDEYTDDAYAQNEEFSAQGEYLTQGESLMQGEYPIQDGYVVQDESLIQNKAYMQDGYVIQDKFVNADNITKISQRERKRNKDNLSLSRTKRNKKSSLSEKNITKVQNLSDIIKKKPEDIDEDILNRLNSILYEDSTQNPESNFEKELELTADTMMNEGLVNEDAYEGRFDTPALKTNTGEGDRIIVSGKSTSDLDATECDEEILDYDEEEVYESESLKPNLENIATSSGKIIERSVDTGVSGIKTYEHRKIQAQDSRKPVPIRSDITKPTKQYVYPPTNLLNLPIKNSSKSNEEFKATAAKLQETLHNFGIEVQVSNISIGPTVTRYEILPEPGVKVSKIVGLTDDIKLNLAASDIRIEAPIPGKSAVGIEVPNKENTIVSLRELFESEEFKNTKAKLNFALGKDIAGKPIVSDIATMPHLLIAGATGAGK